MEPNDSAVIGRLRRGLGGQGFSQAVNLFIRLAEVPLFLTFWGAQQYGEWLIVAAIPAYLALADGGFTGTTQREMTMRVGAMDRHGALVAFQSTLLLLVPVALVLFALAVMIPLELPLVAWFGLKGLMARALPTVVLLLTLHVTVSFYCGLMYGGYACEGKYARGTFITAIGYLLDFAGLGIAIVLGGGPVAAAAGLLVGRVIGLIVFITDIRAAAPWIRFGVRHANLRELRRLLHPSMASMAFPLGEALNIQGMRILVGILLGPVGVATFASIRTLTRVAMRPVSIAMHLIWPEVSLAYGNERYDLIRRLFTRTSQLTLWATVGTALIMMVVGAPLLTFWTRGKVNMEQGLFVSLLIAAIVNNVWATALTVPYAMNRHISSAIIYMMSNFALIVAAAIGGHFYGLTGIGIAIVFGEALMALGILPIAIRLGRTTWSAWLSTVIRPPLGTLRFLLATQHMHRNPTNAQEGNEDS